MATSVRKQADMDADRVKFRGKGVTFTATAGAATTIDYKLTEARLLDGAEVFCSGSASGDSVRFQVVDVDNILGLGANTVLDEFITDWYVSDEKTQVRLPYSAEVLANLYLRFIYTSVGATNVAVYCNLFLHKYLA